MINILTTIFSVSICISFILYITYSTFFWLKILQIKEYRLDRIKDYLISWDFFRGFLGKFNLFPLFFAWLLWFQVDLSKVTRPIEYNYYIEILVYFFLYITVFFSVLIPLYFIFTFKKVLPKFTNRMKLVTFVNLFFLYITSFLIFFNFVYIIDTFVFFPSSLFYFPSLFIILFVFYFIIFSLFIPIITLFSSWIVYPLARHLRQKKIDSAKNKIANFPDVKKLWITWSYAKSSVKEFVNHLISSKYETLCTPENKNTEMWVAMTINSSLSEKYEYFIAEMWAYRKSEIALLTDMVNQKDSFLTWLNTQHIWLFWSQENITKAKMEISESVKKNNWTLYVNFDNELIRDINFSHLNIVSYWLKPYANWVISDITYKWEYSNFTFSYKENTYNLDTNLIWETNFINLAWALCYAFDQNIDTNTIQKLLINMPLPNSTMNILHRENGNIIINDTYNINETWVEKAIDFMNNFPDKNKILVVDDIVDLWKYADEIHFNLWETIASKKLFEVIIVWELFKNQIKNWLLSKWFPENKIKYNLYLNDIQNSVILLEWRRAKKYL